MNCPYCEVKNRADATFCIECGASLDEETLAQPQLVARTHLHPDAASFDLSRMIKPLSWPWPVRIVVLLAILALLFNYGNSATQRANSDLYHAAKTAATERRWHAAATMYKQLADRSYFDAATQLVQVQQQADTFDQLYAKGSKAETAGQDVLAAYYYAQAAAIEPQYYAVDVTLARLRRENGRILYRVAVNGDRAGLYVAEADGGMALKIPESRIDSIVLAISPDGRYVAFSDKQDGTLNLYVKDTRSYNTYTVNLPPLRGSGRYPVQNVVVAFTNGGANLLAIDGGGFGYTNSEPGRSTSAVAYNVRLDSGQISAIGVVDAIAYPNYYDKQIYYTDNTADLRLYNVETNNSSLGFSPAAHLYYMQMLKDGKLLYCTNSGAVVSLFTAAPGNLPQPRKLIELSLPDRPLGFLNPQVLLAPNADRLLLRLQSKSKGTESYLLSLTGEAAAKVLRYDASLNPRFRDEVIFSDSSRGLLRSFALPPQTTQLTPRFTLTALMDEETQFGTYPIITDDGSQVVKAMGFLNDGTIYYVTSQNGATREQVMGDIMIAPVNFPSQAVKLAEVNTDTLANWQPVLLMPDANTVMFAGNRAARQGIYISDSEGKQPLLIMNEAVAFWHLNNSK